MHHWGSVSRRLPAGVLAWPRRVATTELSPRWRGPKGRATGGNGSRIFTRRAAAPDLQRRCAALSHSPRPSPRSRFAGPGARAMHRVTHTNSSSSRDRESVEEARVHRNVRGRSASPGPGRHRKTTFWLCRRWRGSVIFVPAGFRTLTGPTRLSPTPAPLPLRHERRLVGDLDLVEVRSTLGDHARRDGDFE